MTTPQSTYVSLAETNASSGDLTAIELLARRFFEGRGTVQCFQKSYYWSSIGLSNGISSLTILNLYAEKKLSKEEKSCVDKDLRETFDDFLNSNKI